MRPELDIAQRIEFLKLVAQIASPSLFKRKLGLSANDVASYKSELDVESPDEARKKARALERGVDEAREAKIMRETQKAREAEEVANHRLMEIEARKAAKRSAKKLTPKQLQRRVDKIRAEEAERQRRLEANEPAIPKPKVDWHLPIEGDEAQAIDKFRRDILYRGMRFCEKSYGATSHQIKFEATRLGLKINWDIVKR